MKLRYKLLLFFLILFAALFGYYVHEVTIDPPEVAAGSVEGLKREKVAENLYRVQNSWLRKNDSGLWEMYLQGKSFERGYKNGLLSRELIDFHEQAFVDFLLEKIPSRNYLNFLKYMVAWFNRGMDEYIPLEYRKEIYGVSRFAPKEFDFIAEGYHRMINYHAAHDIGHAMQNMNLAACTSFAVWGNRSSDGSLLMGRNFDFYAGETFPKNKIISFQAPEKGHKFMQVTWGGMIGVVSGMNEKGLTVTLNAAKSSIPSGAKTPVSILAREILQYASNIEEALDIARRFETYVSESFMIGSAEDKRAAVIEKSPEKTALYEVSGNQLTLTNHFQSETFKNTELTRKNVEESASMYRLERLEELLAESSAHTPESFVSILRDQKGKQDQSIGMGNEKILNQLVAHHAIIFKPEQKQFWISVGPYQLGKFIAYDLDLVFSKSVNPMQEIYEQGLTIKEDPFLYSQAFHNFREYQKETTYIRERLTEEKISEISEEKIAKYLSLNPDYFYGYYLAGKYHAIKGNQDKAKAMFQKAKQKGFPRYVDRDLVQEAMLNLEKSK